MATPRPLGLHRESLTAPPHLERELLRRIMKELSRGNARRAVPSWSIPREIWRMLLRPRDPDIRETITPAATEAKLNNRLLQTTSSKEMLAIMREIRERQLANSKEQKRRAADTSIDVEALWRRLSDPPTAHETFQSSDWRTTGLHQSVGDRSSNVAEGLHQYLSTKERRNWGPARFRLVHLLCPLAKLFTETYGDIAHTRAHEKSTLTHTAKAGGERQPFSPKTWYDGD